MYTRFPQQHSVVAKVETTQESIQGGQTARLAPAGMWVVLGASTDSRDSTRVRFLAGEVRLVDRKWTMGTGELGASDEQEEGLLGR